MSITKLFAGALLSASAMVGATAIPAHAATAVHFGESPVSLSHGEQAYGRYNRGYDGRYGRSYNRYDRDDRYDRRRDRRYDRRRRSCDKGTGGTIIGAIAGGLIGNEVAGRGDKATGTIIGAAVGALGGRAIDKADDPCRRRNRR